MKKYGLGKGINALIPSVKIEEKEEQNLTHKELLYLNIDIIELNPLQPRKHFSPESLDQLATSIKMYGLIEPIIVQKKEGKYQLIAGERRLKAAKIAGISQIPAILKTNLKEEEIFALTLIENLQREDLNPVDEARAYKKLMEEFAYTQQQISQVVGKSRAEIANTTRILKLCDKVLQMVIEGKLSKGHARTLVAIEDKEKQIKLAKKLAEENFSVRETENLVKKVVKEKKGGEVSNLNIPDANLLEVEQKLQEYFGTKVQIIGNNNKGKIVIHYFNSNDLERIFEISKKN